MVLVRARRRQKYGAALTICFSPAVKNRVCAGESDRQPDEYLPLMHGGWTIQGTTVVGSVKGMLASTDNYLNTLGNLENFHYGMPINGSVSLWSWINTQPSGKISVPWRQQYIHRICIRERKTSLQQKICSMEWRVVWPFSHTIGTGDPDHCFRETWKSAAALHCRRQLAEFPTTVIQN